MAEMLQKVVGSNGEKEKKQEDRAMVRTSMNKSFAEMVKGSEGRGGEVVRVEVKEEEIRGNLRKLEHCLVGSWSPSLANGMDMERFGWLMARTWGLQGKLGLARMEMGRFLLEFQYVGEADRLGLERWRPRCGCEDEGGSRKEVWVKILGLPVSLWVPSILREVGDKCGGKATWKRLERKLQRGCRGDAAHPERWKRRPAGRGLMGGRGKMGMDVSGPSGMGPGFLRIWNRPVTAESRKGKLERGSIWTRVDFSEGRNREVEFLKIREKEDVWKQQMALSHSMTDRALIEEESRYGSGEYYDHSGVACEEIQNEIPLNTIKPVENGGGRWDLVEDITVNNNDKEWERGSMLTFLGFSTEGLEKEILNFLAKIRKRREKIYSRGVLEKTKLLELLEWEEEQFTISCRFRKVEDGVVSSIHGVYGPLTKMKGTVCGMRLGLSRIMGRTRCDSKRLSSRLDHFRWSGGWYLGERRSKEMKLKVWNREVFGRLEDNKVTPYSLVDHRDRVESNIPRIMVKEGTTIQLLPSYGGCPSRFNHMDRIKIDGVWLTEEKDVREGVVNAFQHLLTENSDWKADIERLQLEQLNQQEAENLEHPFSEEEIHSALMEMNGDKAPGPDGFTMVFWQRCWATVKEEVLEMFKEFYEQSAFIKSMNNTFGFDTQEGGGRGSWGIQANQSLGRLTNYWPRF
ncbi:hypothetical protein AAG906_033846 [Vitis piasezkii]